ncbi:hypothetical protein MTP04_19810 [Lysinibacillus sp. PLM2]|nr:hypothetical protein MTP04_19810 [Lysinibacillus sp. PLM2]
MGAKSRLVCRIVIIISIIVLLITGLIFRETNNIDQNLSTGWRINLGGENNGADAHVPSSVNIPSPGEWALLLYTDEKLFDILVFELMNKC